MDGIWNFIRFHLKVLCIDCVFFKVPKDIEEGLLLALKCFRAARDIYDTIEDQDITELKGFIFWDQEISTLDSLAPLVIVCLEELFWNLKPEI